MSNPNLFQAVTWNVYHGSTLKQLIPLIEDEKDSGTALWYLQEANVPDLADYFKDELVLDVVERDQFMTVWNPRVFTDVHADLVNLSEATWLRAGGGRARSQALRVILCDHWGRSIETVNYHLPAHVQPDGVAGREAASRQSALELRNMSEETLAAAFLAAGDDNIYEQGAGDFKYMLEAAMGLRQIQAEHGTFGKRPIDDFRLPRGGAVRYVKGSSATREGTPAEQPSHKRHRITLRWALAHQVSV